MKILTAICSQTLRWCKSRSFVMFVTVIAIAWPWIVVRIERAQIQRRIAMSLASVGVECFYDYESAPVIAPEPMHGPWPGLSEDNLGSCPLKSSMRPPGPAWLRSVFGTDFFSDIVGADASGDRGLTMLTLLPRLRVLRIRDQLQPAWEQNCIGSTPDAGGMDGELSDAGLAPIRDLKHLQQLIIEVSDEYSERLTDAALEPIRHLAELRLLRIRCPQIGDVGLEPLSALGELRQLWLECPQVNGSFLRDIRPLTKLVELAFFRVRLTDTYLEHIQSLHNLERLYLAQTGITDAGLMYLEDLIQLQYLDVTSCPVSDAGLAHLGKLANLRVLVLNDTHITDEGLEHLKGLSQLQVLVLLRTCVTDDAVESLQQALPNCEIAAPIRDAVKTSGHLVVQRPGCP